MCVGVFVCGYEYKICVHCIRAASRILDQGGGANWGNEKCRWGEVIRIICLLMNLTDPRGGGVEIVPRGGGQSMQPCTVCSRY